MQVSIEGQHTEIQPELRTTITEHLEGLNAQHDDIIHARVALDKDTHHQQGTDAARTDPEFTEAYNRIYELALGEEPHVSAKVREFVAIALLAFRGADQRVWWPTCAGPYASAPPKGNCLKSLRSHWFPVEPPRSTAG